MRGDKHRLNSARLLRFVGLSHHSGHACVLAVLPKGATVTVVSTASPRSTSPRGVSTWVLGMVWILASVIGLAMGRIAVQHADALGSDAPFVHDLLALDSGGVGSSVPDRALDSGSQLLFFAVLLWAVGAAVLLLLGVGAAVLEPAQAETAHRLIRAGLWLAVSLCLATMVPVEGMPMAEGWTAAVGQTTQNGSATWDPLFRNIAVGAVVGLLLLAIAARARREASPEDPVWPVTHRASNTTHG